MKLYKEPKINTGECNMAKKAKKAQQGLGILPMTKKQSNPTGNKNQPAQKMPQRGAAPKVTDPRDEAIKLVSKKYEQDKKQGGVSPMTMMPLVPQPQPMVAEMIPPEQQPTPMKEGGMKDKKGLAVVIDMQPAYEEASKGTPADPPPGATADEVKDDQHVLLSEGELVVPANVVRYHGLGMYEGLRREALQGLSEMEKSGQVDYVDDNEPKRAQAGLALASGTGPNVATAQGIAQQQRTYNPALGMYGTATTPQAASAKFIRSPGFIDRNKDGIEDRLQPSINTAQTTGFVPTGPITPAGLALGPVTNPNLIVGAGNVGAYQQEQKSVKDVIDSATPTATTDTSDSTSGQRRIVQQDTSSGSDDNNEMADLGGARTTIGGVDYAIQYDFQGNVIGLANVAEYNRTGQVNFFEPSNEVKGLIGIQNEGQRALMRSPIQAGAEALGFLKGDPEAIERGKDATRTLNNFTGTLTRGEEMAKPDVIYGDAAIDDLNMGDTSKVETVDAPKVTTSANLADTITDYKGVDDLNMGPLPTAVGSASELRTANIDTLPGAQGYQVYGDRLSDISRQSPSPFGEKMPSELGFSEDRVSDAYSDSFEGAPTYRGPGRQIGEETGTSEFQARKEAREAQQQREALLNQPNRQTPSTFVAQNFSEAGKQDVSARNRGEDGSDEGPLGIGVNDNGTTYSRNRDGTFTHEDGTTVNFTDGEGNPGNAPSRDDVEAQKRADRERQDREFGEAYGGGDTGDKSIVCTEMYRQTQLDDWAQAMKIWYVYQRKYLTSTHQIGYHWLFKPFVSGMKVNNVLTNIGAYFAKERTKHLRHILTKGKAKDSIVGNIFCKIIHPIVYLVGCAIHKK